VYVSYICSLKNMEYLDNCQKNLSDMAALTGAFLHSFLVNKPNMKLGGGAISDSTVWCFNQVSHPRHFLVFL